MVRAKKEKGLRDNTYFYHVGDGFQYHKNRKLVDDRISLRCVKWHRTRCAGRAIMDEDRRNFHHSLTHDKHGPRKDFVSVRHLRGAIMQRCKTDDNSSFKDIVQEEGQAYRNRIRAKVMPTRMRSSMFRARMSVYPRIPKSLSELAAVLRNPANIHVCRTGRPGHRDFIYAGSCGKRQQRTRSVIFMTRRMKRVLGIVKRVHGDATWDSRPATPKSSQCFSIVTTIDHQMIPIAVALMESKTTAAYRALFEKLKLICPEFGPEQVVCDFERAQIKAWTESFVNADVHGCYYHWSHDIFLHGRKLGLAPLLEENAVLSSIVRSCSAIPLLPPQDLRLGLAALVTWAQEEGALNVLGPFFVYIRDEWIARGAVLSVHGCEERTNNACESFHSVMGRKVGRIRPNIWRFVGALKKVEDMAYQDLHVLLNGGRVSRERSAAAITNDAHIQNLTRLYEGGLLEIRGFLRKASRRVQGVYDGVFVQPRR